MSIKIMLIYIMIWIYLTHVERLFVSENLWKNVSRRIIILYNDIVNMQ